MRWACVGECMYCVCGRDVILLACEVTCDMEVR
jgi:hypothetical protein